MYAYFQISGAEFGGSQKLGPGAFGGFGLCAQLVMRRGTPGVGWYLQSLAILLDRGFSPSSSLGILHERHDHVNN